MQNTDIPSVVSIAGTDPSGGAGISADIKAISATGAYAASIITALVAQNTQGVQAILEVPAAFIQQQMLSVFSDLNVAAVKIGMLHNELVVNTVFSELKRLKPRQVVLDPVILAKGGAMLLELDAIEALKRQLVGTVELITPNIAEAQYLLSTPIKSLSDMAEAAVRLGQDLDSNVLVKGGHLPMAESPDVLYLKNEDRCHWFEAARITTKNTHGTGCTLSSAIASYLAQGHSLHEAVAAGKTYLNHAIQSGALQKIGKGFGPVDHFYFLHN